jgi:hypothetical protein
MYGSAAPNRRWADEWPAGRRAAPPWLLRIAEYRPVFQFICIFLDVHPVPVYPVLEVRSGLFPNRRSSHPLFPDE